jgi:hypothetical protein
MLWWLVIAAVVLVAAGLSGAILRRLARYNDEAPGATAEIPRTNPPASSHDDLDKLRLPPMHHNPRPFR